MTQSAETGALPALRTARRAGLIEQVIDQLREQIVAGTWAIGSRIPTEAELAQLTGTSRNTVREAVQSLSTPACWSDGRVRAPTCWRRPSSRGQWAGGSPPRTMCTCSRYGARSRPARPGWQRCTAPRTTSRGCAALIVDRNAAARRGDVDAQIAADVAVHRAIGHAAHNPVLTELYENVVETVSENVRSNLYLHGGADENEHVALVDAIEAQDPQRAEVEAAGFLDELLSLLRAQRPVTD